MAAGKPDVDEERCWACGPPTEGGHAAQLMKRESHSTSHAYSSFNGSIWLHMAQWLHMAK